MGQRFKSETANIARDYYRNETMYPVKSNMYECAVCQNKNHATENCTNPYNLALQEIHEYAAQARLCFRCFRPNHSYNSCMVRLNCNKCGNLGHHLLNCNVGSFTPNQEYPGDLQASQLNKPAVKQPMGAGQI